MWIAVVRERLARQYVTIDQMPPPDYAKLKEPTTSSPTIIKSRGGVRKYMFREMGLLRAYLATLSDEEAKDLVTRELKFLKKSFNNNQRRVKKRRKKKPNADTELKK